MKKALVAILIVPVMAYFLGDYLGNSNFSSVGDSVKSSLTIDSNSGWNFDNSGSRIFDMRKNEHKRIAITIESVDLKNIQAACNKKSHELGNGGFQTPMLACSFWEGKSCHIIMPHKVDMRTVGHEIMHCYQGSWH